MDDGIDEGETRAARMDRWDSMGGGGRKSASGTRLITPSIACFLYFFVLLRGTHNPESCTAEGGGSRLLWLAIEDRESVSFVFSLAT
jgi:hypothetical protein